MRMGAVGLLLAAVAGCGDGPTAEEQQIKAYMDAQAAERVGKVEWAVDAGILPPEALQHFALDGTVDTSFIGSRRSDEDVVRTRRYASQGPKLEWDLDQDGRISRDEHTITERELYDATLGLPSVAPGRELEAFAAMRRAKIERLVAGRAVPPVAVRLLGETGRSSIDFIRGPHGDDDIVRARAHGGSGPPLAWDLDQDGRISRAERVITERDLFDATVGPR